MIYRYPATRSARRFRRDAPNLSDPSGALSDEEAVARWAENPYWQYFCGEELFRHELPCHPTSLTKWRNAIEAIIGHLKNDGLLRRNYFKGTPGDAMNTVLFGVRLWPLNSRNSKAS